MTRPRATLLPAEDDLDAGVTVARAAQLLGCDTSTVRRLLKKGGGLEGWRVSADPGRRGEPRVSLASIRAWKEGRRIVPDDAGATAAPTPPEKRLHAAHREAVANLKVLGIV